MAKSGHDVLLDQVGVQLFDNPDIVLVVGLVDKGPLVDDHQPAGEHSLKLDGSL